MEPPGKEHPTKEIFLYLTLIHTVFKRYPRFVVQRGSGSEREFRTHGAKRFSNRPGGAPLLFSVLRVCYQSLRTGRHYTGCAEDRSVNEGLTKSTKNRGPWDLVYQEPFEIHEAMPETSKAKKDGGREAHLFSTWPQSKRKHHVSGPRPVLTPGIGHGHRFAN